MKSTETCKHDVPGGAEGGCQRCISELADDHEESQFEQEGEAAYGRED